MNAFKVSAPTRVDLAGGTLDLWPLYCVNGGGITINAAVNLPAVISFNIEPHASFEIEVDLIEKCKITSPMSREEIENLNPALKFPVFVVSQFLNKQEQLPKKKISLSISAAAPVGSGLGGSSTLCVALAKGLGEVFEQWREPNWEWSLLNWVKDVEAAYLGLPTGIQDYLAALFGGVRKYSFELGNTSESSYSKSCFDAFSDRMLILFSGESHHSGLSNWEVYKGVLEKNTKIQKGFQDIYKIANSLDRELVKKNLDWNRIGDLVSEEWRVRKETFQVNTKRLDEIVEFLKSKKVLGVKVCGAAQGGSLLAMVEPERKEEVAQLAQDQGIEVLDTSCAAQGVTVVPS